MIKLSVEEAKLKKSTHYFTCAVCGKFLYRKNMEEHIKIHNLTRQEYKLLSNKKKSETISKIRGSEEHRKMTSEITKKQWSEYNKQDRKNRIIATTVGMKSSEKYMARGSKISLSKQLTPEKNSLAIKRGWKNSTEEQRQARCKNISESQIGKIISKEQCEIASKQMKQYYKDNPEAKRRWILVGQTAVGRITATGSKPELAIRDYLKEINLTSIKHNVGQDRHIIVVINKSYIPDFIDIDRKVLIEANGCYYHGCPTCKPNETKKYDKSNNRINALRAAGYSVLEVWEHEIKDGSYKEKIDKFANKEALCLG